MFFQLIPASDALSHAMDMIFISHLTWLLYQMCYSWRKVILRTGATKLWTLFLVMTQHFHFLLPSCVQFFHEQHLEILNLNSWYAFLFVIHQWLIISQMYCYILISSVEDCDRSWHQGVNKWMYYLFWNLNEKKNCLVKLHHKIWVFKERLLVENHLHGLYCHFKWSFLIFTRNCKRFTIYPSLSTPYSKYQTISLHRMPKFLRFQL